MTFHDTDLHPRATAQAWETVKKHEAPADLQFHSGWFCPFTDRVWLALEEKGIPYQYKEENPYYKDPEFLKISPKGLVPAVVTDGKAVNDSLIILEYLEDAYPNKKNLLPKDPIERAKVRLVIDHISKAIVPRFFAIQQAQDQEGQDKARRDLEGALDQFVEKIQGPFVAGDQLTIGDLALAPFAYRFFLLEKYRNFTYHKTNPKFKAWLDNIESLTSFKNTRSEEQYYEQFNKRFLDDVTESHIAKAIRSGGIIS